MLIAAYSAWRAIPLLRNLISDPRSPEQVRRNARTLRRWSRGMLRIMGCAVHVHGSVPQGPGLLVSNHLSYLDIVTLGSLCDAAFVAKAEIGRWPILGPLTRSVGTILIDRASRRDVVRVLGEMQRCQNAGLTVVLFPEGTTSSGETVERFKPSLLRDAADQRHPVHFACVRYALGPGAPPVKDAVHWWGDMTLVDHIYRMLAIAQVTIDVRFGTAPIVNDDRRALADALHMKVLELYAEPAAQREGGDRDDRPPVDQQDRIGS